MRRSGAHIDRKHSLTLAFPCSLLCFFFFLLLLFYFLLLFSLDKLRRADDLKKEIASSKNTLEAHIYATRASMHEAEVEAVSTSEQREAVREALAAAEEWLYEQGDDSAQIFHDKLAEVTALSDPIFFRLAEASALPQALNTTHALLQGVYAQLADYAKNRPWVPQAQRDSLRDLADDLRDYVSEQQQLQAKLSAFEPPALQSEQLHERITPIRKLSESLMKIKKPVDKPKKDANTKKDAKKDAAGKKGAKKPASKDEADAEPASTDAPATEETADAEQPKSEQEETIPTEPAATDSEPEVPPKDEL